MQDCGKSFDGSGLSGATRTKQEENAGRSAFGGKACLEHADHGKDGVERIGLPDDVGLESRVQICGSLLVLASIS
jgi:hypothetical protein